MNSNITRVVFLFLVICYLEVRLGAGKHTNSKPSDSPLKKFPKAAVSCCAVQCSDIANKLLEKGGSVADAAIGGLICMGVVHPHSLGLGGGFIMALYEQDKKQTKILNAREMAPLNASESMYKDDSKKATRGGLAVAIPGEMKGYLELHKEHGKLDWKLLFQPTIDMCKNGIQVTKSFALALQLESDIIKEEPSLREIFVNPNSGQVWIEGDTYKRPVLANTLEILAKNGNSFYEGELSKNMITDLAAFGSIITEDDLKKYTVKWEEPIQVKFNGGYTLNTAPPPASGALMGFIMKVLENYLPTPNSESDCELVYQRITETMKFTYAKRKLLGDSSEKQYCDTPSLENVLNSLKSNEYATEVRKKINDNQTKTDPNYYGAEFTMPDDNGTAHLSIVGPNGDAISVTINQSTINLRFGAKIRSRSTGVIFNNQMDDFSSPDFINYFGLPTCKNNFIQPGKRPMSSMCPSIFTDDKTGQVRLVVGAAGGTKITTATALVSMRNLWFGMNIKESIDEERFHHQLFPMELAYEEGFTPKLMQTLAGHGHTNAQYPVYSSVVNGIERTEDGQLQATSDYRKSGSVSGH